MQGSTNLSQVRLSLHRNGFSFFLESSCLQEPIVGHVAVKGTFKRELAFYYNTSLKLEISRPGYHPTNLTHMQSPGTEKMRIKNVGCTSTEKPKIPIECPFCVYGTRSLSPWPQMAKLQTTVRVENYQQQTVPKHSTSINNIRSQIKWSDVLALSFRRRWKDFPIIGEVTEKKKIIAKSLQ